MVERRQRAGNEAGHLMVALVVLLAIMSIAAAKTGQAWADRVQREKEAEMMFRGQEIARGILAFRQDKGAQPLTKLEELLEPGGRGQYFVRRLYKDPLVKDGKWGLLYQGPDNTILDPAAPVDDPFLGEKTRPQNEGSPVTGFSGGTQEIGGLPIIGVKSLSKDRPFRVYKDSSDYSLWHFTIYDVMPTSGQPGQPGQPGGSPEGQRPGQLRNPAPRQPGQPQAPGR